jgi:hypothetical protein
MLDKQQRMADHLRATQFGVYRDVVNNTVADLARDLPDVEIDEADEQVGQKGSED